MPVNATATNIRLVASTIAVAGMLMLPILWLHRESPRSLLSFHGFLHTAVAQRFDDVTSSSFPPENPFYAGQDVSYYWFYHFTAARIADLFEIDLLHAFEIINLIGLVILVLFSTVLGWLLFRNTMAGGIMAVLALAGANALGPVVGAGKVLIAGAGRLHDNPDHMWGIVHRLYSVARFYDPFGVFGQNYCFFLNVTSRPVALALVPAVLTFLYVYQQTRKPAHLVGLALSTALCTAMNPLIGIGVAGALILTTLAIWASGHAIGLSSGAGSRQMATKEHIMPAAGLLLGIMIAVPTFTTLLARTDGSMQFDFGDVGRYGTALVSVSVVAVFAIIGLRRASDSGRQMLTHLLFAGFILVAASIILRLPQNNEHNFFNTAIVLLAMPAAAPFLAPSRRSSFCWNRAWVAGLIFLPGLLVILAAYAGRPALQLDYQKKELVRLPSDSDRSRLYSWVQNNTPEDAIFVLDPRKPHIALQGNVSEFPALTRRIMFTDFAESYMVNSYPDHRWRWQIAIDMVEGRQVSGAGREQLLNFERAIYVVADRSKKPEAAKLHLLYGRPAYANPNWAVYRWRSNGFLTESSGM